MRIYLIQAVIPKRIQCQRLVRTSLMEGRVLPRPEIGMATCRSSEGGACD